MATTVADLTTSELRSLIEEVVHDQLIELLGDPDNGLELRDEVRQNLADQLVRVAGGEVGVPLLLSTRSTEE
jgi:hypothetical protein